MAEWKVYFYLEGLRRDHAIKAWLDRERVSVDQIVTFQEKLDMLAQHGPEMVPGFISETPVAKGIYKMKVKGNKGRVQLRPLCCRGPFAANEYTVLYGAIERDGRLVPEDAKQRAQENLKTLLSDPTRRTNERLRSRTQGRVSG